ncbi:MAG TPA: DUF6788 family protein [Streptosporangiaceae bacterium]|nr:DUF6788 family protein [Streptosporangiaceae bacterium]
MSGPSLPELESKRAGLFARMAAVGDFRRGSISENYRRCGKPNCACAQPGQRGHGPRWLWTRTVAGRGTRGRQLAAAEVGKVRAELDRYQEFAALTEQIVAVSEAICEARPVLPQAGQSGPAAEGLEQLRAEVAAEFAAEVEQLAAAAVASLGGGAGGAGGGGAGDPRGDGPGGRVAAGGPARRRRGIPRPADRLRGRARRGVRVLPGQELWHGARPGHGEPGLVSLPGVQAGPGAARRRAGSGRGHDVAGAGEDDRPGGGRRAVRHGQRAAR